MNMKKLLDVVAELKVGKNRNNSFARYNYRNVEDILQALKPLMVKYGVLVTIDDDLVMVGDRYYIKAIVRCFDVEDGSLLATNVAFAREALNKKGMDEAQVTGSASSYARKYALGGMFNLSVIADPDDIASSERREPPSAEPPKVSQADTTELAKNIWNRLKASGVDPDDFAVRCCQVPFNQISPDRLQNLFANFDASVNYYKRHQQPAAV